MLRGFGKRYFTLASILAHSVMPRLQAQTTIYSSLKYKVFTQECADEEDSPPDEPLLFTNSILQTNKACHCNCVFKKRIRLILLLNHFIPRCPFYTKYFAFRRTGVHPPSLFVL